MKHRTRKSLSLLLCLCMGLAFVPALPTAAAADPGITEAWVDYAQAVTPVDGVYTIETAEQLAWVAQQANTGTSDFQGQTVRLGDNIDLSGRLWSAIGDSASPASAPFAGSFDGADFAIENMYAYSETATVGGLFGSTAAAAVLKNFTLSGSSQSLLSAGALAEANGGLILNVLVNVEVQGQALASCILENEGIIQNVGNLGSITSTSGASAGLVHTNAETALLVNCYNNSPVSAATSAAGLVQLNKAGGRIINCYSSGTLNAPELSGLVRSNEGALQNSYWLSGTATNAITDGESPLNTFSFTSQGDLPHPTLVAGSPNSKDSYLTLLTILNGGATLYNIQQLTEHPLKSWQIEEGQSATSPSFIDAWTDEVQPVTPQGSVYTIRTPEQLAWVAMQTNTKQNNFSEQTVRLANDLDLSGKLWLPIGTYQSEADFRGTFDGAGYTVRGLLVDAPDSDNQGLLGYLNYSSVRNLTVYGSVTGSENVGGIIGSQIGSDNVLENLSSFVTVNGLSNVGGIVGSTLRCTLVNVQNHGSVWAKADAGGIAGFHYESTMQNSINHGDVYSDRQVTYSYAGGIAARSYDSTIQNALNLGTVSSAGPDNAGALLGQSNSTLKECYWLSSSASVTVAPPVPGSAVEEGVSSFDASGQLSTAASIAGESYSDVFSALNAGAKQLRSASPLVKAWPFILGQDGYPAFDQNPLPANFDPDGNGLLDYADLQLLIQASVYNHTSAGNESLDVNGDGRVDFLDFSLLRGAAFLNKPTL